MQFLTKPTARIFNIKVPSPPRLFTVPETLTIVAGYSKNMRRKDYKELCTAARFLYQEKKLPKDFLALPHNTQSDIVCGSRRFSHTPYNPN